FVFAENIDTLFLDTTYCDPQYTFPDRVSVSNEAVKIIKKTKEKTLYVVGTYLIGKEIFVEEIARQTGKKICVNEQKMVTIQLSQRDLSLYTLEKTDLEMRNSGIEVSLSGLNVELDQIKDKFQRIVLFTPTGWAKKLVSKGSFDVKEYQLPYSEHSNFNELVDCVKCVKATHIVPTVVNPDQDPKQLIDLIITNTKPKVGTLEYAFQRARRRSSEQL
ncbi:DNA repair metallo-beta-lactamase, partial [Entamoeba invadens IP1]